MRTYVALSFVCLACSGTPAQPDGASPDLRFDSQGEVGTVPACSGDALRSDLTLTFSASYGKCVGYCTHTVELLDDGAFVVTHLPAGYTGSQNTTKTVFDVSSVVLARIRAEASSALDSSWEGQYGCPDCADQGAFDLRIATGAGTRATRLDPLNHPAFFAPLLADLRQLLAEHPATEPNVQGCGGECFAAVLCRHCSCSGPQTSYGCCSCGPAEISCPAQ